MKEDLSTWFDGEFSQCVTTASRQTFNALFDEPYADVGDVAVDSTTPSLVCRTCDLVTANVIRGTVLSIRDIAANIDHGRFTVREVKADSATVSILRLERSAA